MMRLLWEYIRAVYRRTILLLAGAVGVLLSLIVTILNLADVTSNLVFGYVGIAAVLGSLLLGQFLAWRDVRTERDGLKDTLRDLDTKKNIVDHLSRMLRIGQMSLSFIEWAGEELQTAVEEMKAAQSPDEARWSEVYQKVMDADSGWEKGTAESIEKAVGYSYRVRFEDDSGLTPRQPPPKLSHDVPIERWQHHEMRLQRLGEIIRELNTRWGI